MKKILVTGGTGMVGSAFKNINSNYDFLLVGSQYDLRSASACKQLFYDADPDCVIHLAAKVGGIKGNTDFIADFYSDNILINTNVLNCAKENDTQKVISLLSTCVYPDKTEYPLVEDHIHDGRPHPSNYGYAYAKRMLDVQSRAYRDQYGCNFITAIPNNLFGENDNFDYENSHVIPAIIRKMHEAKLQNTEVVLWGDGSPLREFTYSQDLARILVFLMEKYNDAKPLNVGTTQEYSIKAIAEQIATLLDFRGEIIWDTSKPKGQLRKPSDNSRLLDLGWSPDSYTPFEAALRTTCEWFVSNYPNVRGVR